MHYRCAAVDLNLFWSCRRYEQQREVLSNQQWNMDQLQFTTETTKATIEQVSHLWVPRNRLNLEEVESTLVLVLKNTPLYFRTFGNYPQCGSMQSDSMCPNVAKK